MSERIDDPTFKANDYAINNVYPLPRMLPCEEFPRPGNPTGFEGVAGQACWLE